MRLSILVTIVLVLAGCNKQLYKFDGVNYNSHAAAHEAQDKYYANILTNIKVREDGPFTDLPLNVADYSFSEGKRAIKLVTRHAPVHEDYANFLTKSQMGDWDALVNGITKANIFKGIIREASRHRTDMEYPKEGGKWTLTYQFIAGLGDRIVLIDPSKGQSNLEYSKTASSGHHATEDILDQISSVVKAYGIDSATKELAVSPPASGHVPIVEPTKLSRSDLKTDANGDVYVSGNKEKISDQRLHQPVSSTYSVSSFKATNSDSNNWKVSTDIDPITDAKIVVARTLPIDGGSSRKTQALLIRCDAGDIDVFVSFDDYLGDSIYVTSRIDSKEPLKQRWSMSSNNQSAFYPSKTKVFLKELMQAKRFVVRGTPYNESPTTLVFDVRGLYGKLAKYKRECFVNVLNDFEIESN